MDQFRIRHPLRNGSVPSTYQNTLANNIILKDDDKEALKMLINEATTRKDLVQQLGVLGYLGKPKQE